MPKQNRTGLSSGGKRTVTSHLWVILATLIGITLLMGWLASRL
jgi:hypothetical protein